MVGGAAQPSEGRLDPARAATNFVVFRVERDRAAFLDQTWTVTPQSDRVGYRLSGQPLTPGRWQMISEPLRVGTVQVPDDGRPIVMMRDGPTVGGYPKLGVVDAHDVARLAQCRPGRGLKFRMAM